MKPRLAILKQHIFPALACFALAAGLAQADWFQTVEALTLDLRTRARTAYFPTDPRDDVVLVGIDQASLEPEPKGFGRWPWSRRVHGNLMRLMRLVKPSVVAWDILFDDASPDDEALAGGIRIGGVPTVLGIVTSEADLGIKTAAEAELPLRLKPLTRIVGDRTAITGGVAMGVPHGALGASADLGFVDADPGPDGVRRVVPLVVRVGDAVYPSLSLQSLMHHWHLTADQVEVRLGEAVVLANDFVRRRIPVDATGGYLINYRHALQGFNQVGYADAFATLKARFVDKNLAIPVPNLSGRILLVGQTGQGLADFGPSPFSALTPLVLVHANVLENVLNGDFARRVPPLPLWLGALVGTAASLVFFTRRKFREQAIFALGIPVIFAGVAMICWVRWSVWVPVVWPVLGFTLAQIYSVGRRVLAEQRAKEQIKGMFGTYLAPELVNRMAASGVSPELGGYEENITAYFSDIQGYSGFSETLPPKQLVDLLNEYLTVCTDLVQEEGGTLDKYIGDAVVAMYGAPIALPDHAFRACVTALRTQAGLERLRAKWAAEGERWPLAVRQMRSRIGLNSGPAIVGNMGSRSRFAYTMTGDNVNLAARMESGAKQWGVYIMCTAATKTACEAHGGDRVRFRPLGSVVVKGRTQAVPLFEVFALKENLTPEMDECLTHFSAGLAHYRAREWDAALACFAQSREREPYRPGRDGGVAGNPSTVFLERTAKMKAAPPDETWDGVFRMEEK